MNQNTNEIIELFDNTHNIQLARVVDDILPAKYPTTSELRRNDVCFFRISQLSYDEEYPQREAFENVLLALDSTAYNFVYVLTGTQEGIDLSIGIVKNGNDNQSILGKRLSTVDYGKILANVFEGNFSGSVLEPLKGAKLDETILIERDRYTNAGFIVGVPSINEDNGKNDYDFQGMNRLINSMLGLDWRVVIVCEPVPREDIIKLRVSAYELYNKISMWAKMTLQDGHSKGSTYSEGSSTSESNSKTTGRNSSNSKSSGKTSGSSSNSTNTGESESWGTSDGVTEGKSSGKTTNLSVNDGASTSFTMEIANKNAQDMMKYINDELLERFRLGASKGMFKTSIIYMADKVTSANRLKVSLISLFQGNKSSYSPLIAQQIDLGNENNRNILTLYQNWQTQNILHSHEALLLLSRPVHEQNVFLSTYLTAREVSLIAGMPQVEIPGIALKEGVQFGLNEIQEKDKDDYIRLGVMVQKGRVLNEIPFYLAKKSLAKHTFVAGVTGTGKTTTCHKLLSEANVPFLVIEPAKTEYRNLIRPYYGYENMIVFTPGNETLAPFRINPFELIDGELISAHIDMLKATFTSAFPMEGSMPQILEEAMYSCYKKKGWNVNANRNSLYGKKAFDDDVDSFPILSDLLDELRQVVKTKGFGARLQAEYEGSLVSRLSNLTVGSKGCMLNCTRSINFEYIADNNVIIEMEEIRSPEDKSLLMGFILSRLSAIVKRKHKSDKNYRHLTLIEEAHRLLSKVEYGDSGAKKTAVETFTDLLAEVRKYGEGLIIVDQIPNKLASEVLKNTNTKIVHKILAKDDKESVGDTMLMNDKQKAYLSALPTGHAVIFSENTEKPIQVLIDKISDTEEDEIPDEEVRERFEMYRSKFGRVYDFLEIEGIYSTFCEIVTLLSVNSNDIAQFELVWNDVKLGIENVEIDYKKEPLEIWKQLFYRYYLRRGLRNSNSDDYMNEYVNVLSHAFQGACEENVPFSLMSNEDVLLYLMV